MRLASININFDSLNEAYGFPDAFTDRCFFQVAERFLALADKYRFKYTIFVVGKDLENPRHAEAVREWARQGHEIGNHSWQHHMNLGALRRKEMYAEVRKAHDAIAAAAQVEPKGFISPAWSSSRELFDTLVECGYEYDTSIYPSWLLLPMVLRIAAGYRGTPKALRLLHRRDYLSSLVASRRPTLYHSKRGQHGDQDLCILPLPANRYRFPCWHTTGYMFGWEFQSRLLKSCLRDVEFFYYLTHPGDLVADDDLHPAHSHSLARLKVDLSLKTEHLEKMICQIVASGRKLVTLTEMQAAARERIAGKPQPVSESFATRRVSY